MSLGGKIFLLDIDFRENCITRVALSFANTPGPSTDLAGMADEILLRNLSPASKQKRVGGEERRKKKKKEEEEEEEGVATVTGRKRRRPLISPSLSAFAENLGRLAKSDCLSSPPHLNCFMAITGIYTSLLKVFEHEKAHLEGGELSALCKGNGRPRMHVRGKLGLSIDYWKARRFIPAADDDDGDDNDEYDNYAEDTDTDDDDDIWRVMIEVSEAPSDYTLNPITPVRTSSHWVTDEIKKACTDSLFGDPEDTVTDWLSPPLEELPDHLDPRPPSSRFIARLDPPVAVPFQDELQLFTTLLLAPPAGILADTLEALLFAGAGSTAERQRRVWVPGENDDDDDDDDDDSVRHTYRLHAALKPVYARHIHEVPFSHPKELPGIFAVLRQFVVVATLLRSCFGPDVGIGEKNDSNNKPEDNEDEEEDLDLDSFMASDEAAEHGVVPVDLTIAEQPGVFSIGVIFPLRAGVASFSVEVGRNADVRVMVPEGEVVDAGGVERAVGMTEDLGLAVEWVRRR